MFQKATRLKLRFDTVHGPLTAEDLWDLSLPKLNAIAKDLNRELKSQEEEDFLDVKSKESEMVKLSFDIVLNILNTKKQEAQDKKDAVGIKEKRQKIMALIEKKREKEGEEKSVEQLLKDLDELG